MHNQQTILVFEINLLYVKGQTYPDDLNSTEDGARVKAIPIALRLMQMISGAKHSWACPVLGWDHLEVPDKVGTSQDVVAEH